MYTFTPVTCMKKDLAVICVRQELGVYCIALPPSVSAFVTTGGASLTGMWGRQKSKNDFVETW
jgi:hypothetical protein